MKNITTTKRKPGRPTKVQSAAIAYVRKMTADRRAKTFQVNLKLGRELNHNPVVRDFLSELRNSRRGLLASFAKDALIKAAIEATKS